MRGSVDEPGRAGSEEPQQVGFGEYERGTSGESLATLVEENERLRRVLRELRIAVDAHSIVAITDRRGIILEANEQFVRLSKYTREELIGAPQSIVNSGHHSREFWKDLWATIGRGDIWQGELRNRAKDGSDYWVATTIVPLLDERGKPERYASLRTDTTDLHAATRRLRELAYDDPLTGLANRTAMIELLERCAAEAWPEYCAFITVGLEDLSALNDAFGFAEGDRLLLHTAQRLQSLDPVPNKVARIDSSVFALIYRHLSRDPAQAAAMAMERAEQLIEEVGTTIKLDLGFSIEPEVRVGFAMYGGGEAASGAEIFTQAEIARRRVESLRGFQRPCAYEPYMSAETQARVKMVLDLRHAIAHDELRLFLQPIVGAEGQIEGYEGLIRWEHPERGLVSPADFIPLAEQSGLIVDLGRWVLDEACRVLSEWSRTEGKRHLTLAVNVSERQLVPGVFAESVNETLRRHGAPADRLKLEVTESLMHDDIDRSIKVLDEIRRASVHVALDDFGTGYSSLNYLVELPVNQLKIDRSFIVPVTEPGSGPAVVRAIVELAHEMKLHVVAEGVETEAQFTALRELGVDSFQGYLFGRPAPLICDTVTQLGE